MIENKHRDIYKVVNNNSKKDKLTKYPENSEEYKLCIDLLEMGYFESNSEKYFKTTKKKLPRKPRERAYKKIISDFSTIPISRSEKPKFGGKGRKWQKKKHELNNITTEFHFDKEWGNYIYFKAEDDRWYKIPMFYEHDFNDEKETKIQETIDEITDSDNKKYKISY
jgi:hypothetical protein